MYPCLTKSYRAKDHSTHGETVTTSPTAKSVPELQNATWVLK